MQEAKRAIPKQPILQNFFMDEKTKKIFILKNAYLAINLLKS
jgi:hypothetical protein